MNKPTETDIQFMQIACDLAFENIDHGGDVMVNVYFAIKAACYLIVVLIVKDGNIVSTGCNTVTLDNDPTAHAEVNAIRKACAQTGNFKLDGCVVYSSCEPCPMCLSALYWAGVKKIYYGNTKTDARDINFDDKFIYDELEIEPEERHIPSVRINLPEAILAFKKWADKTDKIEY